VFAAGVEARLGVRPVVLSGDEEALLSFDGAVRNLRVMAAEPILLIDIGGGSTELVLGRRTDAGPEILAGESMDIGSVRLHERHLHSDPPTPQEIAACVDDIENHLDACSVDPAAAATIVGVAGSITTVCAGVLDLPSLDTAVTDQAVLPLPAVHEYVDRLLAMTVAQRDALPYMEPGRADVIGAGALILSRVLRRSGLDTMAVSEADILDGIAWSMVPR
jgi:exopolyphosphatase/guanosine-5'-triphosphate,3'-diphosphate pyrophosphatase